MNGLGIPFLSFYKERTPYIYTDLELERNERLELHIHLHPYDILVLPIKRHETLYLYLSQMYWIINHFVRKQLQTKSEEHLLGFDWQKLSLYDLATKQPLPDEKYNLVFSK